jgi:thioredoxin-related protein
MHSLDNYNVIVVVFGLEGCPACADYTPRLLDRLRQRDNANDFFVYQGALENKIPVLFYDGGSEDEKVQAFADRYKVNAMPTTLVLRRGTGVLKAEGALDDGRINALLGLAKMYR